MKFVFSLFSITLSTLFLSAQTAEKTCFNDRYLVNCSEPHTSYRLYEGKTNDGKFKYNWYYEGKDSLVYKEGVFMFESAKARMDIFKEYYENGQLKSFTEYNGTFKSKETYWYQNGQKAMEREFIIQEDSTKSLEKYLGVWDEMGNPLLKDGDGYIDSRVFVNIKKPNYYEGPVKNGFKDGIWKYYIDQNLFEITEHYEKGKRIKRTYTDDNGLEVVIDDDIQKKSFERFNKAVGMQIQNNLKPFDLEPNQYYEAEIVFKVSDEGKLYDVKVSNTLRVDLYKNLQLAIEKVTVSSSIMCLRDKVFSQVEYSLPITFAPGEYSEKALKRHEKRQNRKNRKSK